MAAGLDRPTWETFPVNQPNLLTDPPAVGSNTALVRPRRMPGPGLKIQTMRESNTELVAYLQRWVPYYRDLKIEKFSDIPPISKPVLVRNFPALVSDEFSAIKEALCRLAADAEPGAVVSNNQIRTIPGVAIEQTTGTTGIPGRFPKTDSERKRLSMGIWRMRRRLDPEVAPGNFLPMIHLPFGSETDRRVEFAKDPGEIRSFYEEAARRKIRWIHVLPRLIRRHIDQLRAAGCNQLHDIIKVCETSGEYLSEADRQCITEFFGCQVLNQYGCIECWTMASNSTGSGSFDVLEENVHLELLRPVTFTPITTPGEVGIVVVTSRILRLLPIVRYLVGDRAQWVMEDGRLRLHLAEERVANLLRCGDQLVPGAAKMRILLNFAFARFGYLQLAYIQFVQTSVNHIIVRISKSEKSAAFFEWLQAAAKIELADGAIELSCFELTAEQVDAALREKANLFLSRLDMSNIPH